MDVEILQYQLLFLSILRRKHHRLGKKRGKDFGCENYLKIERKKPFYNTSEKLTTFRPRIFLKNFRMDTGSFEELLSWVAPFIQKSSLTRSTETVQERR